jgi:SAM-dependent methyltransferase
MNGESLDRAYFDDLYARSNDPWSFATSEYEREKYDRTIAMLGDRRFARALEIGCSIGVLTRRLAEHCDSLLAVDISDEAVAAARRTCAGLANVRIERATLPAEFPPGAFDLIVVSEVGYYWSDDDLTDARARIARSAAHGGRVLLVHFLPKVPEYVRDGDAVHAAFIGDRAFERIDSTRQERYRIDLLQTPA